MHTRQEGVEEVEKTKPERHAPPRHPVYLSDISIKVKEGQSYGLPQVAATHGDAIVRLLLLIAVSVSMDCDVVWLD